MGIVERAREMALGGEGISRAEGLQLLSVTGADVMDLLAAGNAVRARWKGEHIHLCSIINAKSGRCPENCGFCAQSVHAHSDVKTYPLLGEDELFEAARNIAATGAECVGIVTSGRAPSPSELDTICRVVERMRRELTVRPDASLGMLTEATARKLKSAGLVGYHHNIETARSFFPTVCTTHSWDDHLETLRIAKEAGFHRCSGGIFGLGETDEQRLEMAAQLAEIAPDRVCMNFLMPVAGTRLSAARPMTALEILKLVAVYRLMLPKLDLNICAGRDLRLGQLQPLVFLSGANATMVGNYLTQTGREPNLDRELFEMLGRAAGAK